MTTINRLTQIPALDDNDLSVVWQNESGRTRAITIANFRKFIQSTDPNADAFVKAELDGDELVFTAHDETQTRININLLPEHSVTELSDMPDTLESDHYLKVNDAGTAFVLTPASEFPTELVIENNGEDVGQAAVLNFTGDVTASITEKTADIDVKLSDAIDDTQSLSDKTYSSSKIDLLFDDKGLVNLGLIDGLDEDFRTTDKLHQGKAQVTNWTTTSLLPDLPTKDAALLDLGEFSESPLWMLTTKENGVYYYLDDSGWQNLAGIDDSISSTDKTYSSAKVEELVEVASQTPLSAGFGTVNEYDYYINTYEFTSENAGTPVFDKENTEQKFYNGESGPCYKFVVQRTGSGSEEFIAKINFAFDDYHYTTGTRALFRVLIQFDPSSSTGDLEKFISIAELKCSPTQYNTFNVFHKPLNMLEYFVETTGASKQTVTFEIDLTDTLSSGYYEKFHFVMKTPRMIKKEFEYSQEQIPPQFIPFAEGIPNEGTPFGNVWDERQQAKYYVEDFTEENGGPPGTTTDDQKRGFLVKFSPFGTYKTSSALLFFNAAHEVWSASNFVPSNPKGWKKLTGSTYANAKSTFASDGQEYLSIDRNAPVITTEEIDSLTLIRLSDPENIDGTLPKVRKAASGELASGFSLCQDNTPSNTQILQISSGTYSLDSMTFAIIANPDDPVYVSDSGKLVLEQTPYLAGWVLEDGVIIDIDLYNSCVNAKNSASTLIEVNNDEIITPNPGSQFQLVDSTKSGGYGKNNSVTYFQPQEGTQSSFLLSKLDYGSAWAIHESVDSVKLNLILHESLVEQIYGRDLTGVNELTMLFTGDARGRLGKSNQTADQQFIINWNGELIPATNDANEINPSEWVASDDSVTETWSNSVKTVCYSNGMLANRGSAMLRRGDVVYTNSNALADAPLVETPKYSTPAVSDSGESSHLVFDNSSEFFVMPIIAGGGTFNVMKLFQFFMGRKRQEETEWGSITFDKSSDCIGTILKIAYDAAIAAEEKEEQDQDDELLEGMASGFIFAKEVRIG